MTIFRLGLVVAVIATFPSVSGATSISLPVATPLKATSDLSETPREPQYIVDVEGKRVRLVGRRFYTNPVKSLDFPGRIKHSPIKLEKQSTNTAETPE
ncbi:hypothetical protein [Rhizobium herbae]